MFVLSPSSFPRKYKRVHHTLPHNYGAETFLIENLPGSGSVIIHTDRPVASPGSLPSGHVMTPLSSYV